MNDHPFLKNITNATIYFVIWTGLLITLLITSNYNIPLRLLFTDLSIHIVILSILSLPLWFAVKYISIGNLSITAILLNHLGSLILMILTWLLTSYFIVSNIVAEPITYNEYYWDSFMSKIIIGKTIYLILILIYYLIIYYNHLKDKIKNEAILINKVQEAQLNLLKSQINPHFLFNCLNSVSSLTMSNPQKAQSMIIKLSDFLRYSISINSNQKTNLKTELENISRYLDIEKVRFGNRFIYNYQIDEECSKLMIPAMLLQPLYENAIKHGVYESTEQINIETRAICNQKELIITISNNFDPEAIIKKGTGIGLINIRERLALIYGSNNLIQTQTSDHTFTVKLIIPQI